MNVILIGSSLRERIRMFIVVFMAGLFISGVTAFPLETELSVVRDLLQNSPFEGMRYWINRVYQGLQETNAQYPFMAYGYDWLAFAHLILVILFIGPLRDPVRNIWVIEFGLIACLLIFPLAFVAGHVREIPIFWQIIDCSFGVVGAGVLWPCYQLTKKLEQIEMQKRMSNEYRG